MTILACIFTAWRLTTGSLSVDDVRSREAELLYWFAILFSNTLGTALGDFLFDSSGLGFAGGALLVGGVLAVILAATLLTKLPRVALFWLAFVLTRPLGATLGDVLTKSHDKGGADLGTKGSSAVLGGVLVVLVVVATVRERTRRRDAVALACSVGDADALILDNSRGTRKGGLRPEEPQPTRTKHYLSRAEWDAVFAVLPTRYRDHARALVGSGMRVEELWHVTLGDFGCEVSHGLREAPGSVRLLSEGMKPEGLRQQDDPDHRRHARGIRRLPRRQGHASPSQKELLERDDGGP